MSERKRVSLRQLANGRTEAVKLERTLRNPQVTTNTLIRAEQDRLSGIVENRHVLAIQDTTEINYQQHADRVRGLGTVGNGKDVGFFLHPMLVMDAANGACLGSAAVHIENRLKGASENYALLPIEEKESYRWISTAEESKKVLSKAACITFIGDRENDIYEFIDRIPDEKTHIIVRANHDRILETKEKISSHLENQAVSGYMKIFRPTDRRKKQEKREAFLQIKYSEVSIKRPANCTDKEAEKTIKLRLIEVKEINEMVNQPPIHWRILTTHEVNNIEKAKQIIDWYRKRWNVEQVFRTLKKQGLDIESSQLETASGLMKLAIVALSVSIKILQLVQSRDGTSEQKTTDVFNIEEQVVLSAILKKLEGKTEKQKNPYPQENLAWASWIIARLGGWQGYIKREGLAGPITMGRGLERFQGIYDGWNLHINV